MGDKVIQFPGTAGRQPPEPEKPGRGRKTAKSEAAGTPAAPIDAQNLSDDQKKAMQIVLSGMPFVAIGIKSTTSGADFFTAVHGDEAALRNAAPHLPGVIERAFGRKGL
ncbi:MAG TPA: hypothetical protein VEL07_22095 [Planctomycetota bacterium]|nr:hypothetical protein [Planctomycetota bacterium]